MPHTSFTSRGESAGWEGEKQTAHLMPEGHVVCTPPSALQRPGLHPSSCLKRPLSTKETLTDTTQHDCTNPTLSAHDQLLTMHVCVKIGPYVKTTRQPCLQVSKRTLPPIEHNLGTLALYTPVHPSPCIGMKNPPHFCWPRGSP